MGRELALHESDFARQIQVEQVQFVVGRPSLSLRIDHQMRVTG